MLWNFKFAYKYFLVKHCCIGIFEGQVTNEHCVECNPTAPDVDVDSIVALSRNHLGRCVARGAACSEQGLTTLVFVAEAEIYNFNVFVFVQKQVLGFQISVGYPITVQVLYACQDLQVKLAGFPFSELVFVYDVLKKLTP